MENLVFDELERFAALLASNLSATIFNENTDLRSNKNIPHKGYFIISFILIMAASS